MCLSLPHFFFLSRNLIYVGGYDCGCDPTLSCMSPLQAIVVIITVTGSEQNPALKIHPPLNRFLLSSRV
jgi:hypothetical protein